MSTPAPIVSVVIPTYNRAHVLPRALQSVARQTYSDYEVIVVDDGSTDGTDAVLNDLEPRFRERLRFVRLDRNGGAAAARNRGVAVARGAYIAFLDADDEWLPKKLEIQVTRFQAAPAAVGLSTTRYALFDDHGRWRGNYPVAAKDGDLSEEMLHFIEGRGEAAGVFSTLMFRPAVMAQIGGLDETLTCWEDADFYVRAARAFHFQLVDDALTVKHDSVDSISSSWVAEAGGIHHFWKKYREHAGVRPRFRRYVARHQHGNGVQACLAGDTGRGRALFFRSLAIWPFQWHPFVHFVLSLGGGRAYRRVWEWRERHRHLPAAEVTS